MKHLASFNNHFRKLHLLAALCCINGLMWHFRNI